MNELKSLEHATLKVPYEVFNKRYRNAQRILDVEARQVASTAGEVDSGARKQPVTAGEIDSLLGGMVEKLTAMKRKASEAINEELQAAYVCKKRLEHLKEQAGSIGEPSSPQVRTTLSQWRKVRLDRMLVDYFLRNGYYESANKLADERGLKDLTNVDIYAAAAEVEAELSQQRTARCLQWCADNKSKLRKLNSTMEFKIRIQEFIELVREDRRLEAVRYAKKHFSAYEDGQLQHIQHCMGMLAFPKDTEVEPYRSLLERSRWGALVAQFRWEHARLLHPARLAALPVALQLGLQALNTPQCYSESTKVSSCPACQPPLNALARTLPHAHCSHSRLVCRITNRPLDEHNQPMALPNGQVYGEKVSSNNTSLQPLVCRITNRPLDEHNQPMALPNGQVYGEKVSSNNTSLQPLVCRITNRPLDEHNQPMALPNGQVYGEKVSSNNTSLQPLVCRITNTNRPMDEHNQPMALPNGQVYGEKVSSNNTSLQPLVCRITNTNRPMDEHNQPMALSNGQVYGEKVSSNNTSLQPLVCRITNRPLDEHNQPMALPNGQVYGEKGLKEMMREHGSIICPKTKEVFCMKRVEKVYVM